jgi:hypothetical protein
MLLNLDFLQHACCELAEFWKGSLIKWVVVIDGTIFFWERSRLQY